MQDSYRRSRLLNLLVSVVGGALGCLLVLFFVQQGAFSGLLDEKTSLSDTAMPEPSETPRSAGAVRDDESDAGEVLTLRALQDAFDLATDERSQLAATQVAINRQLNELIEWQAKQESDSLGADPDTVDSEAEQSDAVPPLSRSERQLQRLQSAGMNEAAARDLQRRREQYQLRRLELLDQAAREGWDESEQLSVRLAELDLQQPDLREELGDDAYDMYLFESGQSNRIVVDSVIEASAADLAGIQVGDVVSSYAGVRMFKAQELQQATREGVKGESVQLVLEREGQTLTSDLQRGPLGVTLRPTRQAP